MGEAALIARAEAQLNADPRLQQLRMGRGRAQGGGAIDPRAYGVQAPPGYVYSLQAGRLVKNRDWADTVFPLAGAGMLALGGGLMAAGGPAGSAPAAGGNFADAALTTAGAPMASGASAPLGGLAAGAAPSTVDRIRQALTSREGLGALAGIIPALALGRTPDGVSAGDYNALRNSQAITETQMRRADPLHQMAVQLAASRLPVSARQGVTLQNLPLPERL